MGDRYGPIVIARRPMEPGDLARHVIAVPGTMTTAFLVLRLLVGGDFPYEVLPFDAIIEAVSGGRFDAGLIIHEGQLTFQDVGLAAVVDLGRWWNDRTGLPLPLGGNVIRRDLGPQAVRTIAGHVRQSIQYGLDHRSEALAYALSYARDMDAELADRFVAMYVNQWTLGYGPRGRQAVQTLLDRASDAGIVPQRVKVEFVE
jgi:1,4-dihydroxy-6-naphthoate synthase